MWSDVHAIPRVYPSIPHLPGSRCASDRTVSAAQARRCTDPTAEPDKVRQLYSALVSAKRTCGEPTDEVPFDRFEKIIDAQVKQIRSKLNCDAIDFTVEVTDGTVKFRAKAGT